MKEIDKYLAFQFITKHLSKAYFGFIVQKIKNEVIAWNGKLLDVAK